MTNYQAAAGFAMASQARMDLLKAQSQLERISSALARKQHEEDSEQEARDALFQVKKTLLAIEQALPDEIAVLALMRTSHFWFMQERLTEKDFSSFADKEYFDSTWKMAGDLVNRADALLGSKKFQQIEQYYLTQAYVVDNACSMYFLLRARELRESDEKQKGIVGRLFYSMTEDKVKPAIELLARRFGQTHQLDKFHEKVPSSTISVWVEADKKQADKRFGTSLEWLDYYKDVACFQKVVGQTCGFSEHEAFCAAVYDELLEWGLPIPDESDLSPDSIQSESQMATRGNLLLVQDLQDARMNSAQMAGDVSRGLCHQFQSLQADPNFLTNIFLKASKSWKEYEEFGPCSADEVWDHLIGGKLGLEIDFYRTEDMTDWCPLEEYFNNILNVNIWLVDGEQQSGPFHAAAVWTRFIGQGCDYFMEPHYWIEGMPECLPIEELIDKL